jgi:hypothetical protein
LSFTAMILTPQVIPDVRCFPTFVVSPMLARAASGRTPRQPASDHTGDEWARYPTRDPLTPVKLLKRFSSLQSKGPWFADLSCPGGRAVFAASAMTSGCPLRALLAPPRSALVRGTLA